MRTEVDFVPYADFKETHFDSQPSTVKFHCEDTFKNRSLMKKPKHGNATGQISRNRTYIMFLS
jgi:hypothetical protein